MPSTSARSSSRSGLSLNSVPSKVTVTGVSSGFASRAWSLPARLLGRQPANLHVSDPHPVGDLVRVRAVEGVGAHREQEQCADRGGEGNLGSASHGVKSRFRPRPPTEPAPAREQV